MTFGVTVTVHRTTTDRYGDTTDTTSHTVSGCALAPRGSTEDTDRRDTVVTGLTLYGPAGADIRAADVVVTPDETRWQVDGDVGEWNSPWSSWQAGIQVALTRATG